MLFHCNSWHFIVLYCITLHRIVLYCIALHFTALYCTEFHSNVLYSNASHSIVLHRIGLNCVLLHDFALHCMIFYRVALHCNWFFRRESLLLAFYNLKLSSITTQFGQIRKKCKFQKPKVIKLVYSHLQFCTTNVVSIWKVLVAIQIALPIVHYQNYWQVIGKLVKVTHWLTGPIMNHLLKRKSVLV